MAKQYDLITPELTAWIAAQQVFFVATAPVSDAGRINCSPKGGDSFRVLGDRLVAYQDYTGSGAETAAHLRENGRIVVMFCAFAGAPRIVRLHGRGDVISAAHPEFAALTARFPANLGTRAIIRIQVTRISDSCGYAVPLMDFRAPRDTLDKWAEAKGPEKLREYRQQNNLRSLDGLPALENP